MPQANRIGHVTCGGCRRELRYAYGAHSVKCAACSHVTRVDPRTGLAAMAVETVIVENPPSLDENGNEVCACARMWCLRGGGPTESLV